MENKPKHTPMARLAVRELKHTYELCHADMYGVPQGPALLITADKNLAYALAAAPELLAQLKQLYAAHKFSMDTGAAYIVDEMAVTFMAAAIAKAEGK